MKARSRSSQRTGTAPRGEKVAVTATLRIPSTLIRVKSNVSGSTSARGSVAKNDMRATVMTTAATNSSNMELPVSPKVDLGPKAYKVYRNGDRLVIRFCVGQGWVRNKGHYSRRGRYFVWDMDTGRIAAKTEKHGYPDKNAAVRVARSYRDKYGAYVRVGF